MSWRLKASMKNKSCRQVSQAEKSTTVCATSVPINNIEGVSQLTNLVHAMKTSTTSWKTHLDVSRGEKTSSYRGRKEGLASKKRQEDEDVLTLCLFVQDLYSTDVGRETLVCKKSSVCSTCRHLHTVSSSRR